MSRNGLQIAGMVIGRISRAGATGMQLRPSVDPLHKVPFLEAMPRLQRRIAGHKVVPITPAAGFPFAVNRRAHEITHPWWRRPLELLEIIDPK